MSNDIISSLGIALVLLTIGYLVYKFSNWILGKFIQKNKSKSLMAIFFTIILTPIIYSFLIIMGFTIMTYEYHPNIKFDNIKWEENITDRHEMKKDIIKSSILIGKSKEGLINILGNPYNSFLRTNDTLKTWTYSLGFESHGLGIKFHYLNIYFENGIVKRVENSEILD